MKQVKEQVKGFETVFRHSKDGLAIFKDGIFVDCNQSMLDLVDLEKKEQFVGQGPVHFSPEYQFDGRRSAEKALELINRCYDEGSLRFEWIHTKSTGVPFWCEVILTKMVLDGEEVLHTNWRDISEKKQLELKLAEQKESFETLFNESMDGLAIFDGQQYIDCNKAFLTMFCFQRKEDVIGIHPKNISPTFQPDGRSSKDAALELIKSCMDKGSVRFEWLHQKSNGTVFWTEVIIIKVTLNGADCIYAIIRDISEKKELEFQIYERNAELDQSNRDLQHTIQNLKQTQDKLVESEKMASLGSLVAGVSHEINTPVGVGLMGITQFIDETKAIRKSYQQGELDEEMFEAYLNSATELSQIINKNLERTAHLVKSFKQIAVDQTSEEERNINLKDYLDEIIFSLSSVARKSKVSIKVDCDDNYNVVTNPGLLSQLLTNLIINSITHGFSDSTAGNIEIALRELTDKKFSISYKDDGKGIKKEDLPKIFEPFFTTNRANGGTGLGLNVTYNIVTNALGGTIRCRSEENKGVEFTIVFNVKERL